jgi:hypothetical protein
MRQEMEIYEYAIIRLVPKVEREEFINIGVVIFCKRKNYLAMKYSLDRKRLHAFTNQVNLQEVANYLESWERIINGDPGGGIIALEAPSYRFRWVTAPKSTIIQCSKVHPGLTAQPEKALEKIFNEYVSISNNDKPKRKTS